MTLTPEQKTTMNKACENIRKSNKDFKNGEEKIKMAKKQLEGVLKEDREESDSDKFRKLEKADSDECTKVPPS